MATTTILHWLHDIYITTTSWDKSIAISTHNITNYGSSWFDGSSFYNQSANDILHAENNLPITSAAHLGLITGLLLAVLLNSRFSTSKGIDWQYWLETMGMNIMFAVLCLMFTIAILPFLGVFLAILVCYRKAIELYLKNTQPQFVTLLEGLDAIWAVEEDTSLSVINVLAIVEVEDIQSGNELLESFRRAIVSNFATPPFPCPKMFYFRQKCLGYFYWEQQHQLRIADHVRWMKEVEGDSTNGVTEDTLKGIIAEISNSKLPADHAACWEILVGRQHLVKQKAFQTSDVFQAMEEGFPDSSSSSILRYPILFRIHHSLGDGIALMKLLLSGLADKIQITEDLRSRTPSPIPAFLTACDFASAATNSNPNSGRSSPILNKSNYSQSNAEEQPAKPKDMNLPERVVQRTRLPKSEIVIELENLSDEQDRISRSCSPIFIPPTIPENTTSFSHKEQQNTVLNARPTSPFLTPCQSPLPLDQYSHPNSPIYFNSRCLSPEVSFQNHNIYGKDTKRSNSPLLLTTRCHSPIIGKAVLKSPSQKYCMNASHPNPSSSGMATSSKATEDFYNASRSTSPFSVSRSATPFSESRSTTPHATSTRTLVRSQSMSMPASAIHREDSPHMRNATSVQCYQQNTCNCFTSFPQTREHIIPCQGGNITTIYYYNPSGTNGNLNPLKRRETFFERDAKININGSTNALAAHDGNPCSTKPLNPHNTETYARNMSSIFMSGLNNKKGNEILQDNTLSSNLMNGTQVSNEPSQFSREDRRYLAEKEMSTTVHVGSNTDIIKCISTSTQTSPLKSISNAIDATKYSANNSTENNSKRHFRKIDTMNRNIQKHSAHKGKLSSATIDADHSNSYIKKAASLGFPEAYFSDSMSNMRNNATTTEIAMESYEDNLSTFSMIKLLTEIWNLFTNQKNEQKVYNSNPYTPPSTPNPYIQLLNSISTTTHKPKKAISFAQTACALIFAPATLINQTLMKAADSNALHGPSLSGYKVVAWYVDYSGELLQSVKRVKDRFGTHFTDVVLTGLSASLDSYFCTHPDSCGTVPQSVTVVVPARMEAPEPIKFIEKYDIDSFGEFSDCSWGTIQLSTEDERNSITVNNRFSVAMLTLPLNGQQDKVFKPRDRLFEVHHHSKQLRNSPDYLVNYWLLRVVATLLPTPLLSAVVRSSQSTLVVSNMVGPTKRLSMAGSQLRDLFFWVPHRGATGIGVTVLSYMDRLQFGIMADRALVTCQQDAQLILNTAISEIINLETITELQ